MSGTGVMGAGADIAPAKDSATAKGPARLAVHEVQVRFGGIMAIDGASLSVAPGQVTGLIGPNGAGKTTLFDVISGLRAPQRGRVLLDGQDITGWSAMRRSRAGIQRTYQVLQMFGWLSVLDNVTAALDWKGGGGGFLADLVALPTRRTRSDARREQAMDALEQCGLAGLADKPAGSLPIGLGRMVELARATVDQPKVLLLDEPTSGLDATESGRLGERIAAIAADHECGIVLVEHDMDFLMRQCHHVVVLDLGQVLTQGTPDDVRSDPTVRGAYLGA